MPQFPVIITNRPMLQTAPPHIHGEQAFWVKLREAELIKRHELGVIIREGDRRDPVQRPKQWLPTDVPIPVFYLTDEAARGGPGTPFSFEPDDLNTVQFGRRRILHLDEILQIDLVYDDRYAVPHTAPELEVYLYGELYPERRDRPFAGSDLFTLYPVDYVTWVNG